MQRIALSSGSCTNGGFSPLCRRRQVGGFAVGYPGGNEPKRQATGVGGFSDGDDVSHSADCGLEQRFGPHQAPVRPSNDGTHPPEKPMHSPLGLKGQAHVPGSKTTHARRRRQQRQRRRAHQTTASLCWQTQEIQPPSVSIWRTGPSFWRCAWSGPSRPGASGHPTGCMFRAQVSGHRKPTRSVSHRMPKTSAPHAFDPSLGHNHQVPKD
mmetsp:Transcript_52709/g.87928  ORF Transcript_52709/g.87928 Transcript_52709/m.87928 type:complete len:210 (-) Transcript_52709:733-1362(-)